MEPTNRPSCFARLLDVRSYVLAARGAAGNAEPPAALAMLIVFSLICLALLPLWISFDLLSTWEFTTALRDTSADAVNDLAARAEGLLDLPVAALLSGVVFTSFTLLPTLFELAFPTVNHPLLNLILTVSIVFDYVTDWGKASELAARWVENPTLAFLATMGLTAFFSVLVQAVLVCCVTVVAYSALALLRGGARQVRGVIIDG